MAIAPNFGQARNLRTKALEAASVAALEVAVNNWLAGLSEGAILRVEFMNDGTNYQAVFLYTVE